MDENVKIKQSKGVENLIGILLIMPIYMPVTLFIYYVLNIVFDETNFLIIPILMYAPNIIGMFLTYKFYKNKFSTTMCILISLALIISICFFYNTYFVEHEGLDAIGYFLLWLAMLGFSKILSVIFYGKVAGIKKALLFIGIYVFVVIASFKMGYWA